MINATRRSEDLQKLAQRVMNDRNMRIATEFVPTTSKYTLRINPDTRVRLLVSDNELRCFQEARLGDDWILTARKFVQGTVEDVEKAFAETVEAITKVMRK